MPQPEKRLAPRLENNSNIGIGLDGRESDLINISETGAYFVFNCSVLSCDVKLSLIPALDKGSQEPTPLSARVIHRVPLEKSRNRYGVQFSSLDAPSFARLREIIFDEFAKKALGDIAESEQDFKNAVKNFFKKDVKQYHEALTAVVLDAKNAKIDSDAIENKIAALTNEILTKGSDLEKTAPDEAAMKTVKRVFREIAGCWFYKGPIVKMAYDKPRGYPGDYLLFETIYEGKTYSEKESIGYYCDRYFLNNTYAQAVRARKNKMKNILQDQIENAPSQTIRLLNVACGPSREIRELLCDPYLAARKDIIFTGLDYDEEALKFSEDKFKNLPSNVQVRLLHANVLNIFRDAKYYDLIGKQDIIYILGLTEYLPDRVFRKLTQFLFRILNEKGMLVITYKDQAIEFPSLPPEWFCDWTFIKRTREDLLKTAEEIGSAEFDLKIEREGTGTIYFFILTKK